MTNPPNRSLEGGDAIRVLSIEDDRAFEQQIRSWLDARTAPRFEVTPAEALAQVAREFHAGGYDVMLLDLGICDREGREGLETLDCARELAPELPIVVLAAAHEPRVARRAIEWDASDVLMKGCFGAAPPAETIAAAAGGRTRKIHEHRLEFEDRAALLGAFERSQQDAWVDSAIVDLPNQVLSLRVAQTAMERPGAQAAWFDRFQRISGGAF